MRAGTGAAKPHAVLREAFLARPSRLAADDRRLDEHQAQTSGQPSVASIRPAASSPCVSRLTSDGSLLRAALEAGRAAVHAAFLSVG